MVHFGEVSKDAIAARCADFQSCSGIQAMELNRPRTRPVLVAFEDENHMASGLDALERWPEEAGMLLAYDAKWEAAAQGAR